MNYVLAIDTSGLETRVGLSCSGTVTEKHCTEPKRASQQLLCLAEQALAEAEVRISQLDGIGVVIGPGSFTGLRIGIAVAQGLSISHGIPLVGVSTMALSAKSACSELGDGFFLVSQIARLSEMYIGAYRCESGTPSLVSNEFVLDLNAEFKTPTEIIENKWIGVGGGWSERNKIEEALGLELRKNIIEPEYRIRNLLDLCIDRLKEPENTNSNLVLPNYIKEPDYSVTKS